MDKIIIKKEGIVITVNVPIYCQSMAEALDTALEILADNGIDVIGDNLGEVDWETDE